MRRTPAPLRAAMLVAAVTMASGPARADAAMQAAAEAFYKVYGAPPRTGGLPNATQRSHYAAVLSPRLMQLLDQAQAAQIRFDRKVRGAAPPLIEGDIFTSLFEGPTGWTVGTCAGDAATAQCPVTMVHQAAGQQPVQWRDTLVLVRANGGWKVDDVIYDPHLTAGNTGRLSALLGMVVAQAPP
jgi:hypothetical protein